MGLLTAFLRRQRPAVLPIDPAEQRALDQLRARREAAEAAEAQRRQQPDDAQGAGQ